MLEVISLGTVLLSHYQTFLVTLPPWMQTFMNLFLFTLLLFIYVVLIWKMHKFIAKKNIIELNLKQYNKSEHAFWKKLVAVALYLIEYIVILPFLIFFWFTIFTVFVMLLNSDIPINTVLIISAVIVGSIRATAYYKEELSRELAKLIPLNLLVISIFRSKLISIEGIISQFSQIPNYLLTIPYYLGFIIVLEIVLRTFDIIFSLFKKEEIKKEK